MKGGFLLDVVVRKGSAILKLLSGEDESLLIWGDSFLVLDLGLDVLDGVCWLNIKGDGLSCQGFDEDLHTTSESEDEMKSWLFLDVVIREGSSIFELLSGEDKSLLIWGNSFLVLDLCFDVLNGVCWLDIEGDGLSSKSFDEDLHTTSKSEDKMESGFLLDVVVWKSSSILKLLSGEDESLLIWGNSFLILDLGFDVLNSVCWLDIKGDGLTSKSLDEDLHTTSKSEDEMESWFFLDVVVGEGSSIFELLSGEDESLLIWRNTFLILDLSLDVLNSVCWLDIKGDGLTGQGLDEDLHTTSKSKDEMESGLLLDVVVRKSSAIFQLLTGEDESLLIWGDTFFVLDLSLDIFDGVCWLDIEGDGLTCEGFNEDLHSCLKVL